MYDIFKNKIIYMYISSVWIRLDSLLKSNLKFKLSIFIFIFINYCSKLYFKHLSISNSFNSSMIVYNYISFYEIQMFNILKSLSHQHRYKREVRPTIWKYKIISDTIFYVFHIQIIRICSKIFCSKIEDLLQW